jgi:hypothetical protein
LFLLQLYSKTPLLYGMQQESIATVAVVVSVVKTTPLVSMLLLSCMVFNLLFDLVRAALMGAAAETSTSGGTLLCD